MIGYAARSNGNGHRPEGMDRIAMPKATQTQLGRQLRMVYGELAQTPLPVQIRELLDRISRRDRASD